MTQSSLLAAQVMAHTQKGERKQGAQGAVGLRAGELGEDGLPHF